MTSVGDEKIPALPVCVPNVLSVRQRFLLVQRRSWSGVLVLIRPRYSIRSAP